MKLTFAPRGIIQIDDARIMYKNLSGKPSQYNRAGDRDFSVVIPNEELADQLVDAGWNVKVKEFEDGGKLMYLKVKVKFNDRGPVIYLKSGMNQIRLDEETVGQIDYMDIASVDMDIRPYDWEVRGEIGRTAYLSAMRVTQNVDRFATRFAEEEFPRD